MSIGAPIALKKERKFPLARRVNEMTVLGL
jgi:hypothetical protein